MNEWKYIISVWDDGENELIYVKDEKSLIKYITMFHHSIKIEYIHDIHGQNIYEEIIIENPLF